jgi:sec-independent protein translocase protein TatB
MLPQFGLGEILVVAMLALIVVGPKDLPVMARKAGQFLNRMKAMGQEFKDAFTQMGEDEDVASLKREIEELKSMGKLSNLSDKALSDEIRELNSDIGKAVKLDTPAAKPPAAATQVKANPDPKPEPGHDS